MSGTENHSRFASIVEAAKAIPSSFVSRVRNFSLIDFEESVAGKPGAKFLEDQTANKIVSYELILFAVILGIFGSESLDLVVLGIDFYDLFSIDGLLSMLSLNGAVHADGRVVTFSEAIIFSVISTIALILAWWITLTVLIKQTFRKSMSNALLGISTAWIIFIVTRGLSHFILIEADWVVVWANRDLVMMGQLMKEQMTQSPGSHMCIDVNDCYGINQRTPKYLRQRETECRVDR